MTAHDFARQAGCPDPLIPRLALRLRDAFGVSFVPKMKEGLARRIVADFLADVRAEDVRVAEALGFRINPAAPVLRTAASAPRCPRCGNAMLAGVKIAQNIPVYYCTADRVALREDEVR